MHKGKGGSALEKRGNHERVHDSQSPRQLDDEFGGEDAAEHDADLHAANVGEGEAFHE